KDSDYDVRFLYVHRRDRYLSLRELRDVIEPPVEGDLDYSGWDLRKALMLFRKSNPPLLEWLGSPIVYIDRDGLADRLRKLLEESFSPQRCMHHYLHMAQGNFREYLKGDIVRLKKYLYVLRPLLACLWIERHGTMPPTEFRQALDDASLPPPARDAIDALLLRKMGGTELDTGPRIPVLNEFFEELMTRFEAIAQGFPSPQIDFDPLDSLFREMLDQVPQNDASDA
ncbi:MAG: nucleotidyltransferase domain-containing protein, partial [Desulfobacterales bacterium]|nr:nucleotidyltransferase domain-containing protein [Desulfobacterales bacterium]